MHNHKFLSVFSTIVGMLDTIFINHKYCYKCVFCLNLDVNITQLQ